MSLRQQSAYLNLPIVLLTARSSEEDRVSGLEAGADDYIVKPFLPRELIARIKTALRHRNKESASTDKTVLCCAGLHLNEEKFETSFEGKELMFSVKEFRIMQFLAKKPDRVFSRAQILEGVWANVFVDERTVDVHMLRIRKQLLKVGAGELIETIRGLGYRMRSSL